MATLLQEDYSIPLFYCKVKLLMSFTIKIKGIIRCLENSENRFLLAGKDYSFAMNIFERNGVIGHIPLVKTGDKVKINDPLLTDCNAVVTRVDWKKGHAKIEYEFAGTKCTTWATVELVEKSE